MRRDFVVAVSGLPRSGTSLAMQMLAAGGLAVLVDSERPADADNPRGYFEYAPVRASARDARWLAGARGRAVKVVHALLSALPATEPVRVVLLRRALPEVLASQRAMLARRGQAWNPDEEAALARGLARGLDAAAELCRARPRWTLLELEHARLILDPRGAARALAQHVGGGLDLDAMAACVDPALYRQRRR